MSEKFVIEVPTRDFLDGVVKDLSRLRQWVAGFEAAGGAGPKHKDALWRAHQLLGSAVTSDAPHPDPGTLSKGE